MLRFVRNPLNITTNNYHICVCGDIETKSHLFLHYYVHRTARATRDNNVRGLTPNVYILNALSVWTTLICCVCWYSVHLVRWSLLQLLILSLFMTFWNPVKEFDCTRYDFLCFFFMLVATFLVLFLWKLDVTRQNCTGHVTSCCKFIVKQVNK